MAWANGDGAMQGIAWAHICHGVNIMEQNVFGVSMSGIQPQPIIHLFFYNFFFGMFFLGGCASIYSVGVFFCLYASS
jgi:hypothetical protein